MRSDERLDYHRAGGFHQLPFLREDRTLLEAVDACCDLQRRAARDRLNEFQPYPRARALVSPEALEPLLASGADRSDITTESELSNCLVFHVGGLDGSLIDREIAESRAAVDARVARWANELFRPRRGAEAQVSGHFLYPPGSHMGWHTNSKVPGWRLYVNRNDEPGKSFFRYRDPGSGEVVTAWDEDWSFRLFRIQPGVPLWHCVHTETTRFSFGYRLTLDDPLAVRVLRRLGREMRSRLRSA
jgi:hypothetical protein